MSEREGLTGAGLVGKGPALEGARPAPHHPQWPGRIPALRTLVWSGLCDSSGDTGPRT